MYLLNLILLQVIVVFLIDLSGAITSLKRGLSSLLTKGRVISDAYTIPLISCSSCCSFHTGWIYLLATHQFTILNFFVVCLLAFFTPVTKDLLFNIKEATLKLINKI